jgi:hypothetical protein
MSSLEEQLKLSEFMAWDKLHNLVDTVQLNPNHIHEFLNLIRDLYHRDISRVKVMISERVKHCDALVARLQYLELHDGNHVDHDLTHPEESLLSQALSEESKVFDFDSAQSLLRLQPSGAVAINCDTVLQDESCQTAFPDAVAELRAQNLEYLAVGLAWKRKYEHTKEELKRIATERVNEMQEIYGLLNSMPIGRRPRSEFEFHVPCRNAIVEVDRRSVRSFTSML